MQTSNSLSQFTCRTNSFIQILNDCVKNDNHLETLSSKDSSVINLSIKYSNDMTFEESVSVNSVEDYFITKKRSDTESVDLVMDLFHQETHEIKVLNVNTCKVSEK